MFAYAELYGHFDFNSTPLGIPNTRAVIFYSRQLANKQPTSFSDHGKEGWYIGPCMNKN
jgi:hypothetical protein